MYIPLQLRLTLFSTLVLALALWFFGQTVYAQAEQRAYRDLDNALSSRAASVQLGKTFACTNENANSGNVPCTLPSVDALGTGGVSIEVLDEQMNPLATTNGNPADVFHPSIDGLGSSPIPWDRATALSALQQYRHSGILPGGSYSTITYQGQHVHVYTLISDCCSSPHVIQTARSEQDIAQSLADLRNLLWQGSLLVLAFAFIGGWFISWSLLTSVRRITKTARAISASGDFSRRVPGKTRLGRDELTILSETFNSMLYAIAEAYQRQQRFIADASHELRAPITSIRCNLDLLAKAPDLPTHEAQAALHDTQIEADRMGRLVNDLLLLARADSLQQSAPSSLATSKQTVEQDQQVDLDSLLLEVFRQYQRLRNDNQEYQDEHEQQPGPRIVLQHITPARVYGHADQLKQVLVALLDNALKYTPPAGTISLSLTTAEHTAHLKVSDTGAGILPQDLPHIFERFYRVDRSRSRERGGSGLGLAIAQSIVQAHSGSIEVESAPGKGTTFLVKLPLV